MAGPKPESTPLTLVGKIAAGVALIPAIIVLIAVVAVGVPIPFTNLILHSVWLGVISAVVVYAVLNAVLRVLLGVVGLKAEKVEESEDANNPYIPHLRDRRP